jgi:hypothetical protein
MQENTMTQPLTHRPAGAPARTEAPSGRHPVNIGHLVMGLAFVGLVGVWALIQGDAVDGSDIRWLLPVPWVLAGIAGLLATTLTGRDRWATRQTGWVEPEAAEIPEAPRAAPTEAPSDTSDTDPQVADPRETDSTEENR